MDIIILDTGDNYILTTKTHSYEVAMSLYKMMSITINTIPTGISTSQDTADFVVGHLGRIFSYGFNDTDGSTRMDIPAKLVRDVRSMTEFHRIKKFWAGVVSKKKVEDVDGAVDRHLLQYIDDYKAVFETRIETPRDNRDNREIREYLLFNTIYELALVANIPDIEDLTVSFPEFVVVEEVGGTRLDGDTLAKLKLHFHLTSFASPAEIAKKMDAFKELYNIDSRGSGPSEKKRVRACMDEHVEISHAMDNRMKANDLYKEIIDYMCVPMQESSLFKKRLAGYLNEFSLQKKRFSDAYYYYGIVKKATASVDLAALEKERDVQRKTWSNASTFQVPRNPTIQDLAALEKERDDQQKNWSHAPTTVQVPLDAKAT